MLCWAFCLCKGLAALRGLPPPIFADRVTPPRTEAIQELGWARSAASAAPRRKALERYSTIPTPGLCPQLTSRVTWFKSSPRRAGQWLGLGTPVGMNASLLPHTGVQALRPGAGVSGADGWGWAGNGQSIGSTPPFLASAESRGSNLLLRHASSKLPSPVCKGRDLSSYGGAART